MEDDAVKIDGVDVHIVRVLGTVESVEESSTFILYTLSDNSGTIECKRWIDKETLTRRDVYR